MMNVAMHWAGQHPMPVVAGVVTLVLLGGRAILAQRTGVLVRILMTTLVLASIVWFGWSLYGALGQHTVFKVVGALVCLGFLSLLADDFFGTNSVRVRLYDQ